MNTTPPVRYIVAYSISDFKIGDEIKGFKGDYKYLNFKPSDTSRSLVFSMPFSNLENGTALNLPFILTKIRYTLTIDKLDISPLNLDQDIPDEEYMTYLVCRDKNDIEVAFPLTNNFPVLIAREENE